LVKGLGGYGSPESGVSHWLWMSLLQQCYALTCYTVLYSLRSGIITSSQSPPSLSSPVTPSAFHSRLNSCLSQILSYIVFLFLPDCLRGSWTCTELSGHWRLFVLVSSFHIFKNSSIISYHISRFWWIMFRYEITSQWFWNVCILNFIFT